MTTQQNGCHEDASGRTRKHRQKAEWTSPMTRRMPRQRRWSGWKPGAGDVRRDTAEVNGLESRSGASNEQRDAKNVANDTNIAADAKIPRDRTAYLLNIPNQRDGLPTTGTSPETNSDVSDMRTDMQSIGVTGPANVSETVKKTPSSSKVLDSPGRRARSRRGACNTRGCRPPRPLVRAGPGRRAHNERSRCGPIIWSCLFLFRTSSLSPCEVACTCHDSAGVA